MPSPRRLAPLALLAAVAAACGGSSTTTGTSTGATTTGTGGMATTTTGTGGMATTTTASAGGGGSGAGAPQGCKEFVLSGDPDQMLDATVPPASPGGLAWDGAHYEAVYTGTAPVGFNVYYSLLNPPGTLLNPPGRQSLSLLGADGTGGPVVAAGAQQGTAWSDRRTGDYEIFFSLLKGNGTKIIDDLRITSAQGFSLNPALAWTGSEFLAVWQDDRNKDFHVFGQRVSEAGALVGGNVEITKPVLGDSAESPQIAAGPTSVGIVYIAHEAGVARVAFQILGLDLTPSGLPAVTFEDAMGAPAAPTVVWNFDRYVVAWQDTKAASKAIRAAAFAPDGSTLVPPTSISVPGDHASRSPRLLPLGDSLLAVYADDRDQNGGFELYARTLSPALAPLSAELRVTSAMGDSLDPVIAAGPGAPFGDVGILFRDDRTAAKQNVFFTRLKCKAPGP
jgi:hypothetical protein